MKPIGLQNNPGLYSVKCGELLRHLSQKRPGFYVLKRGGIEMTSKKYINLGIIIIVVLAVTFISSCNEINTRSKKVTFDLSELIQNENIDDVSLSIYYVNPHILTRYPWSVDHLIKSSSVEKIVINGSDLEEHFNSFNQLNNIALMPVKHESRINARLYYVLESKKNGKLFNVSMWGDDNCIFVNGIEVQENDIFYDFIMPFLPDDAVKELESYLN
ncbi:hypothetical protein [Paenibacillus sp. MMS18-CY102]|uniref:hypothetical protein n=1 Tax=Paenibacillus sp. MMS18-CY102 TaxID=2682849 RepID=UPI0013664A71|nr:hypothetical protein [Paenibacillus sp. MMS18-CY102]MWC31236.1 hypothetical protein [Paenibacillus sp. MMS18-CY102]